MHVKEVREIVNVATVAPLPSVAVTAPPVDTAAEFPNDRQEDEEEDEDDRSTVAMMQDASVQTSETGQDDIMMEDVDEADKENNPLVRRRKGRNEDGRRSDESDASSNEEISRCTQTEREESTTGRGQVQLAYPNSSDTASDLGGLLDSDKMHPEGDDYKIVFISSDSSKSGDSMEEGSFEDAADIQSHSRQTSSSVHDSESAAGFIDESDWDFFAARGQQPPQPPVPVPIIQHPVHSAAAPPAPPSTTSTS